MSGIGPGLMGRSGLIRPLVVADPVQTALDAVVAGFSSAPSGPRQTAMYNLISALMSAGIWAKLDRLFVYRASEEQGGLINWKNPGTGNASKVGTPTFTADLGFSGFSSGNYITTGFDPSTAGGQFSRNDNCLFTASTTDSNDASSAATGGNTQFSIQPRSSGGALATRNASSSLNTGSANTGAGLYATTRNNSANYDRYKGGTLVDTVTQASTALSSAVIYGGTHNALQFSTKNLGLEGFGANINGLVDELDAAWTAYVAAL